MKGKVLQILNKNYEFKNMMSLLLLYLNIWDCLGFDKKIDDKSFNNKSVISYINLCFISIILLIILLHMFKLVCVR